MEDIHYLYPYTNLHYKQGVPAMTEQLLKTRPENFRTNKRLSNSVRIQHLTSTTLSPERVFEGLWRSPNGSLYIFTGDYFVCVSICSGKYVGWLNKIAVKDVHKIGDGWVGMQAFRNPHSGVLFDWVQITLEPHFDQIIKRFPSHLPDTILVNGHIETYRKVRAE